MQKWFKIKVTGGQFTSACELDIDVNRIIAVKDIDLMFQMNDGTWYMAEDYIDFRNLKREVGVV